MKRRKQQSPVEAFVSIQLKKEKKKKTRRLANYAFDNHF